MHNSWKLNFFQSLNHVKPRFLIKSGYYIVPNPSTTLVWMLNMNFKY